MTEVGELLARAALIGVGAAALMDAWGVAARRALGIRGLDYALLGRWIGHFPRGRFVHDRIGAAKAVRGERILGWAAHYTIGVAFAIPLLVVGGVEWATAPTFVPALVVGLVTIAAPWLVMQPSMGAGVAGSRTPNPAATRVRNLVTHAVYGIGLYGSAVVVSLVWR
jgi:hypothetical protein